MIPAVEALHARFDVPLCIDTWRASVARASFAAGAVVGNDISGFADPDYLDVCAAAGASVVATHIRLRPRVPDPDPQYDDVVASVRDFLLDRARQAEAAGIPRERIMLDAGLDLGKREPDSLVLLRASDQLAELGYPLYPLRLEQAVPGTPPGHRGHRPIRRDERRSRARDCARLPHPARPRCPCGPPSRPCHVRDPAGGVMAATVSPPLVQLVKGDEPSIMRDAVLELVDALVGDDGDRSLMVEEVEVTGENKDDRMPQLAALVDAAQTPPFLTPRRIVVGRGIHAAKADELTGLSAVVAEPLPDVFLVLTWESGAVPKRLADALKAGGGAVVETSPGRNSKAWLGEHLDRSGLKFDAAARELLAAHLGEDVGRLRGLFETLVSTFGPGAKLSGDDISPYLGDEGALAPWSLTDAIDKGDIPARSIACTA